MSDDTEYSAAECKEPHTDGSLCIPDWDGYGYVCTYRIVNDRVTDESDWNHHVHPFTD